MKYKITEKDGGCFGIKRRKKRIKSIGNKEGIAILKEAVEI